MKVRWRKGPPHGPTTLDMLPEEGLRSGWIHMELSIVGGFGVGHLDRGEVEDVRDERSNGGKSENW